MSSNLRAEPVSRKKLDLNTALKFALRKVYGNPVNTRMDSGDIKVLEAMAAAGSEELAKDAKMLIEFIHKHGDILVKEEY